MNTPELTKEFVLSEVQKLQYLYKLKYEIRYAQNRGEKDYTESVAEHIFGMHLIAQYFLPLVDPTGSLNKTRIYEMATLHDIDEIETGDVLGYIKNETARDNEGAMARLVIERSPGHMQEHMHLLITEYEEQKTLESRFVKAVDKFEPLVHIYNEMGKKVIKSNGTTSLQSESIKDPYLREFTIMYQYYKIIHQVMIDEGFFS